MKNTSASKWTSVSKPDGSDKRHKRRRGRESHRERGQENDAVDEGKEEDDENDKARLYGWPPAAFRAQLGR